jgi:hypothetical protein
MSLSRWQRVAIVVVLTIPLLAIIVLSLPIWLCLPFSESGREFILKLVQAFTEWVRATASVV